MATRIKSFRPQARPQSCTALAIKVALHELGISAYPGLDGGELSLWQQLKRSSRTGDEDIMPHAAVTYLQSRGCTVEVIEDPAHTLLLSGRARSDYIQYTTGLTSHGIVPHNRPLDLTKDFADDARVFIIVGFIGAPTRGGPPKLLTHTVLCRKEGGMYWTLNPDGGTDKAYSLSEVQAFLANTNLIAPVKPEFASKKTYIYTGINYRATSAAAPGATPSADDSVWVPGEANPPYERLLQGTLVYRGQSEHQFKRDLEFIATAAARRSTHKNLRVIIFGPKSDLEQISKWTESTIANLNRSGYEFRISRAFFEHGLKQVRFYDH
jgi:hypothetical protein